jgi:phenylacetate-CoA ligase
VVREVVGTGIRGRDVSIDYATSTGHLSRGFVRQNTFLPSVTNRLSLSLSEPIERIIAAINGCRPDVIGSYGSYLELLFRMVAMRGIDMHLPKAVLFASDMRLIEEDFGVPVLSRYNAVEVFKLGFTCRERTSFHLHDDLTHVKIVDANGQRVAEGEKGEVVISNLVNRGTVLLNYRSGDVASATHERCPCGRTLPLLATLEGRVEDILHLPDGRFIHPRLVCGVLENTSEILRHQLIQHDLDTFEFRVKTVYRQVFDLVIDDILADLRHLLGETATIRAEYCERLRPYGGGRKIRPVLSLVKPNDWITNTE